jgi:hypothetical protein
MRKIWVKRARSFKKAERSERDYYSAMSGVKRLETVQFLREIYRKIKGGLRYEGRERLRRAIRVI